MVELEPMPLRRACRLGLVAGAFVAGPLAILGVPFFHFVALALILLLGMPTLLVAAAAAAIGDRTGRWQRVGATFAAAIAGGLCFLAIQAPGFAVGHLVVDARVDSAKAWCEELVVKLDRWREEHGSYPSSLEETPLVADPPLLCRAGLIYKLHDGVFVLDFPTRMSVFSAWCFRSDERRWKYYS